VRRGEYVRQFVKPAVAQRFKERGSLDNLSPRHIHENRMRLQQAQLFRREHMLGLRCERTGDHDEVARSEKLGKGFRPAEDARSAAGIIETGAASDCLYTKSECGGASRDFLSDVAKANEPERCAK